MTGGPYYREAAYIGDAGNVGRLGASIASWMVVKYLNSTNGNRCLVYYYCCHLSVPGELVLVGRQHRRCLKVLQPTKVLLTVSINYS